MVGETGFEPATPWSRTEQVPLAPVAPEFTQVQTPDSAGARRAPGSHTPHEVARDLDAWTASGLRAELPSTLPAPGAELFIRAGAIVAERALSDAGSCAAVEVILRRASDQAAAAHR